MRSEGICVNHVTRPKSLAERLQWMADNLPGFRAERDAHDAALARLAEGVGCQNARTARSEARTERTDLAANSAFFDAPQTPEIFHQRRSSTADESGLQD